MEKDSASTRTFPMTTETPPSTITSPQKDSAPNETAEYPSRQGIPQVEVIPSEIFVTVLTQFKPKPYYLTPSLYISLLAVCISMVALYLSYLTSPVSTYTIPKIEYS